MFSPGTRRVLLLQLALVTAAAAVLDSTNGSGAHKLTVGFQAPWNLSLPFSALRMGSALQLAMEKVNSNPSLLGNYSLDFVFLDTECDPKTSLGGFIHQVWKENVSALFGPACPEEAEVTGLIASTWNIPMFGFVGQSSKMDSRDTYDSYIKIVPPLKRSAEVLVKTLKFFGWTHVAMIGGGLETNTWDKVDDLWKIVENQLKFNFNVMATVKFDTSNPQLVSQKMKYIATVARVIVILTNKDDSIALLLEAEQWGLMKGDYVFFLLQHFEDNLWKNSLNDRDNQVAIAAFDMAFVIGQKSYEGYEYYDFFEQVSPYSAYLHDAILLYAMGLKEIIKDGSDPYNGQLLLQKLRNKNDIRFYDIALLTLLVAFPLMGVLAVSCIGLLVLQKLRLQTRLDDSSWWLINYSDITVIRESTGVRGLSLSNTASHNGSSSSQSNFSSNSYGLKDKTGKENIYTTIGLYQVAAVQGFDGRALLGALQPVMFG
ncbi:unnamed protein product [Tetraodon nigroviridis]|uniref:Chromosome 2 SCAF14976, whole genome shotgun sequence n=1 Tax=Tetraodon nigroviridis TaxID=99883 RepID=Q4RYJ1_TETNG|nr:unnamed protein product [Tetraodon nigroviridis]